MTKPVYEVIDNANGTQSIQRTDPDGKIWSIPFDEANTDYQAYLNPVEHLTEISPQAALSTPIATDEPATKSK